MFFYIWHIYFKRKFTSDCPVRHLWNHPFAGFAFLLLLKMGISRSILDPRKKKQDFFLFFRLNVNNIIAHNKLSLLEAYNTIYKYDILCISETYLDSSVSVDDTTLSLPGYSLVRSDHLTMLKGVVLACILKRIYLWDQLMYHSFLSVCYVKWPFKVKKVMSLLSIDLQVNQQLNLMNSY